MKIQKFVSRKEIQTNNLAVQANREIRISLYVEASEKEIDRILDYIQVHINPAEIAGKTLRAATVRVHDCLPSEVVQL